MAQSYSRSISAIERLSLTANELHHYNVDGVIEGVGEIEPERLQAAVDRAAEANPGVRVRLRGWLGWARWVDSGIAPRVRILPRADWNGDSEVGASFLKERLDAMHGGPVADVLVVPCTDGRMRYVFRNLHGAIDGRGAIHWVLDAFRILRGEPPVGSTSTLADFQVQAQYADKVTPDKSPPVRAIPVVAPGKPDGAPLHFIWRRCIINRSISQILPKTAVFLADYARRREPGEVAFTIPIDYRGLRTQELGTGNLTGYIRLMVPDGAGARLLMSDMRAQVESFADCRPPAGAAAMRWLPFGTLRRRIASNLELLLYAPNKMIPTGGLVSMGLLTAEAFSCPGFRADGLLGIPGAVGKLNIVFVNRSDSVVVCFTAPARYNDRGQFDKMVATYQSHFSRVGNTA